jgi:hypothetical protein
MPGWHQHPMMRIWCLAVRKSLPCRIEKRWGCSFLRGAAVKNVSAKTSPFSHLKTEYYGGDLIRSHAHTHTRKRTSLPVSLNIDLHHVFQADTYSLCGEEKWLIVRTHVAFGLSSYTVPRYLQVPPRRSKTPVRPVYCKLSWQLVPSTLQCS